MRSPIPPIHETAEELHSKLLAEKRKRLKVRIMALWMLKTGQCETREAVAEALDVHRHTITRWLTKYKRGGLNELLTIRTRPNRKRVVPPGVMRQLDRELRSQPEQFSSFRDVQTWLKERYGLDVKYKTIYRLVKYELGLQPGQRATSTPDRIRNAADSTPANAASERADSRADTARGADTSSQSAATPRQAATSNTSRAAENERTIRSDRGNTPSADADDRQRASGDQSLASILRSAARFINDNNSSPSEVDAAVEALASLVRSSSAGERIRNAASGVARDESEQSSEGANETDSKTEVDEREASNTPKTSVEQRMGDRPASRPDNRTRPGVGDTSTEH